MAIKDRILNIKDEDYFKKVNLHVHSNCSDGLVDFDRQIELAHKLGLSMISITDHNTVDGYKTSKYKDDEILIRGVEFDCIESYCFIHILGYGVDIENEELKKFYAKNDIEKSENIRRLLYSRNTKEVIKAIHASGGIAVLAHPCCYWVISLDRLVKKLISYGLDGIETYYPYKRFRKIVKFHSRRTPFKLAKKYNLIQTGGLDNHEEIYC